MTTRCREFIAAEKQAGGNVVKACDLLQVSRSAFYAWHEHVPSLRALSDAELTEKICAVYAASQGTYGAPRVHAELAAQGFHVGRKRVAGLMVRAGLMGRCRRRTRRTTFADPDAKAMNLLERAFGPENLAIDTVWAGDITYVRTWEGWAYLATVIDLASRKVVGRWLTIWESSLVCEAMCMALRDRRPSPGLMYHSDRGSQYLSHEFRQLLEKHHITQSVSRPAQCLFTG
jgi:putative transposase